MVATENLAMNRATGELPAAGMFDGCFVSGMDRGVRLDGIPKMLNEEKAAVEPPGARRCEVQNAFQERKDSPVR